MRRVGVVIAALAALALPAAAQGAPRPVIGCANFKKTGTYQYLFPVAAPGTCTLLFRNSYFRTVSKSGTGKISGTKWKNWGHGTATGKGWLHLGAPGAHNMRATMKAYDKRSLPAIEACRTAQPYYAKVAVKSGGRTWTFSGRPTRQC